MTLKYKLIKNSTCPPNFYRLKALRDFGEIKADDFGGYVNETMKILEELKTNYEKENRIN